MFRSRFLLFIPYLILCSSMLESRFGRHRSVFFLLVMWCVWSSHVRPVGFSLCQRKIKREENDGEKKEKQYFQFIFSYVDFRRFTKLSLIFYWIGYCGQFLYQIRLLSRQSSITLSPSLRLVSSEWVSQLFSNQTGHSYEYNGVISIFNILQDIHKTNLKTKHTFYYLLNCDFPMSLNLYKIDKKSIRNSFYLSFYSFSIFNFN